MLYLLKCLSETGCWKNNKDLEDIDFVLGSDQVMQCISYNICMKYVCCFVILFIKMFLHVALDIPIIFYGQFSSAYIMW
jgi:hypothetical protein